jgi:hypothetical protein
MAIKRARNLSIENTQMMVALAIDQWFLGIISEVSCALLNTIFPYVSRDMLRCDEERVTAFHYCWYQGERKKFRSKK